MIQPQTQTREYWVSNFIATESDIENLYNHFLEVENPQTIGQLAQAIIVHRVTAERQDIERRMEGRTVYQPHQSYTKGDQLVFSALKFAPGTVKTVRQGYNPEHGAFKVIGVQIDKKVREFAAELTAEHPLSLNAGSLLEQIKNVDAEELYKLYGDVIEKQIIKALENHPEFIRLGNEWFVKPLLADISIGHLHLAEAALDVHTGGPLSVNEILVHLELGKEIPPAVQAFSLNHAMLQDDRFDEVAPKGDVAWYLQRLEPDGVKTVPERLIYKPVHYDRALISPQLRLLERELDDEWSDIDLPLMSHLVTLSLTFPHRWAGTLPLSVTTRPLFPVGRSPHQLITLIDAETNEELDGWIVQEHRYIYGLKEWYDKNEIPVGGFISLRPGEKPGTLMLDYDRRRKKKEYVRLANVDNNNRLVFEHEQRSIGCRFDDLMIVGTDFVAAVDGAWQRAGKNQRSLVSILAEVVPALASLAAQNSVHAKTIYSAVNMLKRVPPGPIFAELVRHPAFRAVGDHYWQFDPTRWRDK